MSVQWRNALLGAVTLVLAGCGAAGVITSSPSATTTVRSTPVPKPVATLASTTEVASKAPAGAITVAMTVDGSTARPGFEPQRLTARAGRVVFFLENVTGALGSSDHNMLIGPTIRQGIAGTPRIEANKTAIFTVNDLAPGSYVFWCSVKDAHDPIDHAALGMVGTLTVTP